MVIHRADMKTTHEEADNISVQQIVPAAQNKVCIKVICDDIDVFALLLHHYNMNSLKCKVYMEGTSLKRNIFAIGATVAKDKEIVPKLIAVHVLTGCDTVSYFGVWEKPLQ